MVSIRHQSITSADGKTVGIILDIETFQKIESIIEDHGLAHLMDEAESDEQLKKDEAIKLFKSSVSC